MRIIHRLSIESTAEAADELVRIGVSPKNQGILRTFEVEEGAPSWPQVAEWIRRYNPIDVVHTSFSAEEIESAKWLQVEPQFHWGYPQPEKSFGYLAATYDLEDFCDDCGIGRRQKHSFTLKGEPKWGRNGILQLNWVFDEFFAKPEIWRSIFRTHSIGYQEVYGRKASKLDGIVQLKVPTYVKVCADETTASACRKCGRKRYAPPIRGFAPPFLDETTEAMVKSYQYFGSGHSAFQLVFVRNDLAADLRRVRGISLRPVSN